jgi:hypothetical protein
MDVVDPRVPVLAELLVTEGYFDDQLAARRAAQRLVQETDLMAAAGYSPDRPETAEQ